MSSEFFAGLLAGIIGVMISLIIIIAIVPTNFEKCSERYKTAEDVTECMWLLENN